MRIAQLIRKISQADQRGALMTHFLKRQVAITGAGVHRRDGIGAAWTGLWEFHLGVSFTQAILRELI